MAAKSAGGRRIGMRYPKDLAKGGTIGFLAPSFGCNTEPYRSAFDHALDSAEARLTLLWTDGGGWATGL